jgi:hypothetical protein
MLLVAAFILFVLWLLGFSVFHIAGAAIHLLLVVGVIALVAYVIRAGAARRASV